MRSLIKSNNENKIFGIVFRNSSVSEVSGVEQTGCCQHGQQHHDRGQRGDVEEREAHPEKQTNCNNLKMSGQTLWWQNAVYLHQT
ncbi:hypothetical protein CDAR_556211 [Caerostris darwini]|uniref:Uncharacterized protein n=1 Tax=Caerostris darwini TaxID=1538125 RepID=A0AAV4UL42_9ARAC|nr:hypothetical protein CDAR_556211 [Caerostris darwini]